MLTGQKGLAKVSGTPGKTRLVNHFRVEGFIERGNGRECRDKSAGCVPIKAAWYLVDLPGYGYARASKTAREGFGRLITDYVTKSEKLWFLFVLVDARHAPQKIDMEFMAMLGEREVPFGVVFTKADKLGTNALAAGVANYKQELLKQWEELPPIFVTSSEKHLGGAEILEFIDQNLE
jgi:GTP-binding protein